MFKYFLFLSLFSFSVFALPSQIDNKKINIKSGYLTIKKDENIAEFEKNVFIKMDDYKLYADKMFVYYVKSDIDKIIIKNNIKFIGPNTTATADNGIYNVKDNLIILTDNVKTKENKITMSADKFIYNTLTKKTTIDSKKRNRIEVILGD